MLASRASNISKDPWPGWSVEACLGNVPNVGAAPAGTGCHLFQFRHQCSRERRAIHERFLTPGRLEGQRDKDNAREKCL